MDEILPGIHHWTAFHEGIRVPVHSYYVEPAGVLIDPMVPEEGIEALGTLRVKPQQVIMTNHHHVRHSDAFRRAFSCVVRANARGLEGLDGLDVRPYYFGDEVGPGVVAVEISVIGADETALHIRHGGGAIAFADGLVRPSGATIGFAADAALGAHPFNKKRGLKEAFRGLLLRDFDALLFAHGEPLCHRGKTALRRFVEEPVEYPEYGRYG